MSYPDSELREHCLLTAKLHHQVQQTAIATTLESSTSVVGVEELVLGSRHAILRGLRAVW